MKRLTRRELEDQVSLLEKRQINFDGLIFAIVTAGHVTSEALRQLIQDFSDDPSAQMKVARVANHLADSWDLIGDQLPTSPTASKH